MPLRLHPLPFVLLLLSPPALGGAAGEIAIYPGFEKSELGRSTRAVLEAARSCAARAEPDEDPESHPALAPHLAVEVIDGEPVALMQRDVEIRCQAEPVRRCAWTYAWAEDSDQVGYASIQCHGSHDDPLTGYLVTAAVDLRKAKREGVRGTRRDKASILTSLTFQTDAFPGLHVTSFVEQRRRDGSTITPLQVVQFDDYATQDEASGALTGDELSALASEVLRAACTTTQVCPGPPTRVSER